ncbi:MAG: hypothetical protein ACJ74U_13880 [Jatrophihabitantaceae bacterium]
MSTTVFNRKSGSLLAIVAMILAMTAAVVATAALRANPAGAAPAPSVVKDVSANSVGSGVLFGGRDEALAVNPVNSNIVLAAVELGGVWRSTNAGANWSHVDSLPLTSMDDVEFAASDPSLVIATGEYDGTASQVNAEIYVSRDGGVGWTRANTTSCGGNSRSAHKIAFGSGTPGSLLVVVATDCGLVRSTDSGATWSNVSPAGVGSQFWDVHITGTGPNFTVDTCANTGFYRATDGGTVFTRNSTALNGGSVPCRIATAPTNNQVVMLSSYSPNPSPVDGLCMGDLQESDNGGTSFTDLNATQDGNCRPALVKTSGSGGWSGAANNFEVFFGTDSNWIHEQCDLNNLPGSTACPVGNGNNGGSFSDYDSSIQAVHNAPDSSDLAFDASGCPFLSAGDGGVFATTNGCTTSPAFTASNAGLHGLQATANAGSSYTGHTDLYFSTQDNGIWNTGDGGTSWSQQGPDVYGVFADQDGPPSQVIYKECCFIIGGQPTSRLFTNNEGMTSQGTLSAPPGNQPAFGNILGAQFGYQRYALLTADNTPTWRIYVTTNNGGSWTQLGSDLPAGSNPAQLLASGTAAAPTFYLLNNVGGTRSVTRITGPLTSGATFTPIGSGLSNPTRIAVSPSDPLRLYAEDDGPTPAMMRSINGGASFIQDATLTGLITAAGQYSLPGTVTAIGLDGNSSTVLVGTIDNGIFASTSGGATWAQLRGSTQISRSTGFFFDEKTGKAYTASAGRAEWELDLPHADLSITKTHSPDPVIAGQQLTWHITVKNNGPDASPDVTVTDTLPSHDSYLTNNLNPPAGCTAAGQTVTCSVGDLSSGQSVSFNLVTLVAASTVADAGSPTSITNTASVGSAAVADPDSSNNTASDTAVINDSADLQVTKLCKPDTTVLAGTPVNCTVFVDNHGPSDARSVVIDDTSLSSGSFTITNVAVTPGPTSCLVSNVTGGKRISCSVGNLAAASTTQAGRVSLTYTITANDGQDIDNLASVRGDTPDPDPTSNSTKVNLTVSSVADLALTKTAPASVVAGTSLSWTLSVHNNGPSAATNVTITDTVPAGVSITSVTMSGASCSAGVPGDSTHPTICTLGTLPAGATSSTMTVNATVNPSTTGVLHNDARVGSATFDSNNSNDLAHTDTTVTVSSALSVTIAATPNPVTAGTALSYRITVANAGPSTATSVALSDVLPAPLTFNSTGGVGVCGFQTNTNTVSCQLPSLDPGQSEDTFIYTTVKSSTTLATISDTATATSSGGGNATGSVTTPVQTRADLAITLASDLNVYKPSTTIHYQITMTNYGPSDAQHVVITQALPAVKQGKYVSNNIGCQPPSGTTLTCTAPAVPALATVPAGGVVTFQVNFFITGNKGTITSSAAVTSTTTDPVNTNNSSTRVVTVK